MREILFISLYVISLTIVYVAGTRKGIGMALTAIYRHLRASGLGELEAAGIIDALTNPAVKLHIREDNDNV